MKLLHGGNIYDENLTGRILDFSANINPLGMPDSVRRSVLEALDQAQHYPDPLCRKLKKALAGCYSLPETSFICGNGGADLIYRFVYATDPKKAFLTAPTFAEYEEALRQTDAELVFYRMDGEFQIKETILDAIDDSLDLMFLCNPNNPTGLLASQELLEQILERCRQCGVRLFLDECFLDFTGQEERSLIGKVSSYENLFVLKSFTKMYAMPGIRLGYGICRDRELLDKMEVAGQCWGVSVLAAEAGIAALSEQDYCRRAVALVREERRFLKQELERIGLQVWDGQADYLFFRAKGVTDLYERLLPHGILIRRCGNYRGLSGEYYRVAVKDHEANKILADALRKIMKDTNG